MNRRKTDVLREAIDREHTSIANARQSRRIAIEQCIAIVAARHGNDYTAVETIRILRALLKPVAP